MDLSKLTTAHKIGLGGAVVLLVASFLPWYSVGGFGVTFNISGWDAEFWAWFGILLGLAAGVVLALKAFGTRDVRAGGMAPEQVAFGLGALSFVFILLRLITESNSVAYGLFVSLVAAAAIAYGSFRAMSDAGMSMDDMKKGFGGGGSTGGPTPPPENPPTPGL